MSYFLLKSEPEIFSFDDLLGQTDKVWDNVTNAIALQNLHSMEEGAECIFFHAGQESRAVGIAKVASVDKTDPKGPVIHIAPGARLEHMKTIDDVMDEPMFDDSPLATMGRISVIPLSEAQWQWFIE